MLAVKGYPASANIYWRAAGESGSATDPTSAVGPKSADAKKTADSDGQAQVSQDENKRIEELKRIDQTVKAHEAAHMAAAGGLAKGGASFSYTKGPDGKLYATAGEVSIDTSSEKTPEATIQKMSRVRAAALAPADPSGQDRQVAAQAAAKAAQAAQDLATYNRQGQKGGDPSQAAGQIINALA